METEVTDQPKLARRRRVVLIVSGAILLVVVVVIVASMLSGSDNRRPPEGSGLLDWAPRGAMAQDQSLIASAEAIWHAGVDVDGEPVVRPRGPIYLLWADRIGAGRLVLIEALGPDGMPYVAQASEEGDPAVLGLDAVEALPEEHVDALSVTYDGNLHIDGLEPGRGSALIQLLPEPPEESTTTGLWRSTFSFEDDALERVELKPSGMSKTFLQIDRSDPEGTPVVITTTVGASPGIARTIAVRGGHLVPADSRIALVDDPAWGPTGRILGDEYAALSLVATKLGIDDAIGFVAARVPVDDFDLGVITDLVVFRGADGRSRVACVVTDGGQQEVIPDDVFVDPTEVELDRQRVVGGSCPVTLGLDQRIVALAAVRPGAGQAILMAGDRVLGGPAEAVAAVLDDGPPPDGLVARLDGDDSPGSSYDIAPVTP